MNVKIFLVLALALPLSAQAQAPIPDIEPVHVVVQKSLIKGCYHNAFLFLDRRDVAKGLGGGWSAGMNQLRNDANRQAAQVCREGWPAVKFTFLRGKRAEDLAITVVSTPDRVTATP